MSTISNRESWVAAEMTDDEGRLARFPFPLSGVCPAALSDLDQDDLAWVFTMHKCSHDDVSTDEMLDYFTRIKDGKGVLRFAKRFGVLSLCRHALYAHEEGKTCPDSRSYSRIIFPDDEEVALLFKEPVSGWLRHVEVVNAGVAWYTSAHSLVNYVLQMRYFNPDVVVVMHAVNDLYRSFHKPGELPCERDYGSYAGPLHRLVVPQRRVVRDGPAPKRSFPWTCALWQIACRALSVVDPHHDAMLRWTVNSRVELPFTPGVPPPETGEAAGRGASEDSAVDVELEAFRSLPQYEAHLDYLTRLCREDGCDVVLATQASLYTPRNTGWPSPPFAMQNGFFRVSEWQYVSAASLSRAMRAARAVVCRVASRHEVVVADVETALDGRGDAFIDDFHLSVAGNRVAADTVAGVVRGILSRRTEERSGAGSASAPTASPGGGQ